MVSLSSRCLLFHGGGKDRAVWQALGLTACPSSSVNSGTLLRVGRTCFFLCWPRRIQKLVFSGLQVHESLRTDNYGEPWGPGDVVGFLIKLKSPSPEELR